MNEFKLTTKEERIRYVNFCFNVVGAGFGEEIDERIKNKKCVKDFIEGLISVEELSKKLVNGED